jgi:hypothetical protein
MALLQVLKLTVETTAGSGSGATTNTQTYYFQGSTVYKQADIATATGIKAVDDFENDEPLIKIEQLLLSKKLMRLVAECETTVNGKKVRKGNEIYVSRAKAAALLGGNTLNGKNFTIKVNGADKNLGIIKDIRTSSRDSFY